MPRNKSDAADFAKIGASPVGAAPVEDQMYLTTEDLVVQDPPDVERQERRTLAVIVDDLETYQDTRAMAKTDLERAEIDAAIEKLQSELISKTDRYTGVMRRMKVEALWEKTEEDRHSKRRKRIESAYEFLENYAIKTLASTPDRAIKGHCSAMKLAPSPGRLEVLDEQAIPSEYKAVAVKMPLLLWERIAALPDFPGAEVKAVAKATVEICKDKAARAIKAGEDVAGADMAYPDLLKLE